MANRVRNPKQQHLAYRRNYLKFKEWLDNLRDVPCMDCGIKYPSYIMEFDHTRGDKEHKITTYRGANVREKELLKCDVVCANCHRIRTYERGQLNGKRII